MNLESHSSIGRAGVQVSKLGLGTTTMGNLYRAVTESESDATLILGIQSGITHIDTAPYYGAGLAEERVGRVVRAQGRDRVTIATKVGRRYRQAAPGEQQDPEGYVDVPARFRYWDFSARGIRASLEESLERMGLDHVDILYLHDPDDFEEEACAESFPELLKMRSEGIVGAIGCGMNQWQMLTTFVEKFDLDVVLLAGRYTLLDQSGLGALLPACIRTGTRVVVGGPYNSGLLANPHPGGTYNYVQAPSELVAKAQRLQRVCADFGVPLTAAALQFPFGHPAVASVLTGSRSTREMRDNVASFEVEIPDEMWNHLKSAGLLDDEVPVPVNSQTTTRSISRKMTTTNAAGGAR